MFSVGNIGPAGSEVLKPAFSRNMMPKMGKASKKLRPCPALGREISPAECGEKRQSELACPETCPHNPFGPGRYSQLLEIEDCLDQKTMARLAELAPDRASLEREIAYAERKGIHAIHAYFVWKLFFATGADGATFGQRWEQCGLKELKNDERVLLRGKMRMRIALLEIHEVSEGGRMEAVDLLSADPAPMTFQDRNLAGMASRFSTLLAWIYPLPHYWRLSGTALTIPDMQGFDAAEIVREVVGHLGGPVGEPEIRGWLAEHFLEFNASLLAVSRLRRRQRLAAMDAKFGTAIYELRAPFAQCRERLDTLRDVVPGHLSEAEENEGFADAREWFDDSLSKGQPVHSTGQVVLGRVLLGQSHWRLETVGAEKLSRLRTQIEEHLGDSVRFSGERIEDIGAQMSANEPAVAESLVPPRLLENPEKIVAAISRSTELRADMPFEEAEAQWRREADREFLDEQVPALSNRTPREAARDPSLRPKLIHLMKQRVRSHDAFNLETGGTEDINWMLRELDLGEILFAAPPWRPPATPLTEGDDDWSESPETDENIGIDLTRPPAPPLPYQPFDMDEAIDRLQAALEAFETGPEAEAELSASGATVLEDADQLTMDLLREEDFCFAVPFLLQAWFALVPLGCRAPEIDFADLEKAFASNLLQFDACAQASTSKKLESFFQSGPQPNLMLVLLGGFLEAANTAPKEVRPAVDAQPVILALLKSVVEILDEGLRLR